jgi:hypothetical protein
VEDARASRGCCSARTVLGWDARVLNTPKRDICIREHPETGCLCATLEFQRDSDRASTFEYYLSPLQRHVSEMLLIAIRLLLMKALALEARRTYKLCHSHRPQAHVAAYNVRAGDGRRFHSGRRCGA